MSDVDFDTVFAGFADAGIAQTYDTKATARTMLDQLNSSYQPLFERIDNDPDNEPDPADLAQLHDRATVLAQSVDVALLTLIADRVPSAEATANKDFQIEDIRGMPVAFEAQMARLRDEAPDNEHADKLRIANLTLEQNFQALLDHLTAKRIAEEMDTPTYIERLRGGFKRVHDGAVLQAVKLKDQRERTDRVISRTEIALELADFLKAEIGPRLSPHFDDFDQMASALSTFSRRCNTFSTQLGRFLHLSSDSLAGVHQSFCADSNIAGAEGESRLVSREIERRAIFRPLPLLWALFVTFLVKVILAHNTSETLHYQAVSILAFTFVATWILSIYIGIWARSRRMKYLRKHTQDQLHNLLRSDADNGGFVEFPAIGAQTADTAIRPISAFTFRGMEHRHKQRVLLSNLWALVVPAVLFTVVWITREDVEHDFIARFPESEPCVLASGHLVFATERSYYVQPSGVSTGIWDWALNRIFPELTAVVVDRTNIISARKFVSDDTGAIQASKEQALKDESIADESLLKASSRSQRLRECVTVDPDRNRYTLTHNGNAVGVLGTQSSLDVFSTTTQQLIEKIGGIGPNEINFGGDEASFKVDLGETSLEVLAQAIAQGGQVISTDPAIAQARATLELELSKDAADIDTTQIVLALRAIQARLGDDSPVSQALSVAFGGTTLTAPDIDLPEEVLLWLNGAENEDGGEITLNLGDTSLDVLAQAIAQGGTSAGGANDPAIANARAMIELALTGDAGDTTQIISAINIIKEKLGGEATVSQALSLAYGGTTLVSPAIEVPDVLIELLNDNEGGLSGELKKLRVAFEATQELATSLSTNVDQKNEVYVTMLNEQLPLVLEKQDELIAVLSAGLSQNIESPVMVTPIVLNSNLVGPSKENVLTQSIFQTSIEVTGSPASPVTTIGNTLVLPFFTAPVLGDDEPLINPQSVFNWGANVDNLNDPVVAENETTYFNRIADTLSSCLAGGATLELDIIGLASRSWDGPTGGFPRAQLNYFLAEGRRVAALRLLGEFIPASDQRDRILVQLTDDQFTPLSDILSADTGNADAFISRLGRFNGQSGFENRRDRLVAVVGLSDDEKSPLEELFARSVVLRMIDAEQGPCRF